MRDWRIWKGAPSRRLASGEWCVEVDGSRITVADPQGGVERADISNLVKVVAQVLPTSIYGLDRAYFLFKEDAQPFCYIPVDAHGIHEFLDLLREQKGCCGSASFTEREEASVRRFTIFQKQGSDPSRAS